MTKGGRSRGDDGISWSGPRLTLLATSVSYVLVILDTSIVNVALERIAQDFAIGIAGLQWVVSAYVAVFASLVLSGGVLADTVGAGRIYLSGLLLFTTASLLCGCAPSLALLVGGRVLQGVGAALLVPSALSLLAQAYPNETARARAIAAWASFGGIAQILGPLGGGVLLEIFDWRSIFLVNVPICRDSLAPPSPSC
jgi:MFS transporter, DHA2 family, methylenomycin A resistance protein